MAELAVREATSQEWVELAKVPTEAVPIWGGVVVLDEQIVGHGFLSLLHGIPWMHDLKNWGPSPFAVVALYKAGIKAAKAMGYSTFTTDVAPGSGTHRFYLSRGFEEVSIIMRGEF